MMQQLVFATTRIGIGFVPYVGPALDFCECVTGKAWCLPDGEVLSDEQRIFSGLGVAVGAVGKFWGGVEGAAVSPSAKVVAKEIELFGEDLALALRASRKTWYKTLRGAVTSKQMDEFERKAALYLLKDEQRALLGIGDDGVRKILGIPKDGADGIAQAPDFLSVTKGNKLALSEVKGIVSEKGTVDVGKALQQLQNAVDKLNELNLAGDVSRVEIITSRGAKLATDYGTKDGYLINTRDGKTIHIKNFPLLFIKVVEL